MNKSDKALRDELLEMEKPNAGYRREYEKEIRAMFEKKLNHLWRVVFAILSVIGLLVALPFIHLASSKVGDETLGLFIRVITVSGVILALAWTALTGWAAVRGKLNLRIQPASMAATGLGLAFFFMTYLVFVFVLPITWVAPTDNRPICGLLLALVGFVLVATVGLCLILHILYRTEFRTREKLLEIEYRLVDLSEKIENKTSE